MNESRQQVKVGVFVFIGLALMAALLLQFSKGTILRPSYTILLRAGNVGGLKTRAQVLMAGVQVGTVSDIQLGLQGTNVTITLKIYKQYPVHKDARFLIEASGFLGDQYVAINPTKNEGAIFADGDTAETEAPFNLQEVARAAGGFIKRVDETAKNLNDAISDVRRLALTEETLTNLSKAVGNFNLVSDHALTTVDNVNFLIVSNKAPVSVAISNVVWFSEEINRLAAGFSGVLNSNSTEISAAVKNVESSTVILKNLLEDVQAGKGAAGSLIRDEALAANLSQIVSNLSVTTSNLNRLGLWGILWQHKPPRTDTTAAQPQPLSPPKRTFD